MRLVDSHCHLNADRFEGDADQVLGAARLAGVERILVPGWNLASSRRALDLVERFDWLDAAVGVHPHDAAKADDAAWAQIVAWASDERVVAIGETGLDFDRVFSPIPDQLTNLRRNLALAVETGKPAILHCRSAAGKRDAQDALLAELRAAGVGGATWAAAFGDRPPVVDPLLLGTRRLRPGHARPRRRDQLLRPRLPGGRGSLRGGRRDRPRRSAPDARRIRRSWHRPGHHADATNPSTYASRRRGSRSGAGCPRTHSGRRSWRRTSERSHGHRARVDRVTVRSVGCALAL